jgi:hypothetical protein
MEPRHNVVQVEFFPPIGFLKHNYRFYDRGGELTAYAREYEGVHSEYADILKELVATTDKEAKAAHWERFRRAQNRMSRIKAEVLSFVSVMVEHFDLREPCAVELADRTFRLMEGEEQSSMRGHAAEAAAAWIFVFKPAPLEQVDGLKLVGAVM